MAWPRHLLLAALGAPLALTLATPACRSKPSEGGAPSASAPGEPAKATEGEDAAAPLEESFVEAGNRFRDAEPKVVVDPAGPVDAACSGAELAFAAAVVDPRCSISAARAKQLRAILERDGSAGALPLRQEAKVLADGRVALRLVNTGPQPLTLPLSFSARLPAFSVIAEDERHSLVELAPPRLDVTAGSAEARADNDRPHFARIVIAAHGAAVATIAISTVVERVLRRAPGDKCDGGACAPSRLPRGHYTLHIGELLTDVEVGAPARVEIELP